MKATYHSPVIESLRTEDPKQTAALLHAIYHSAQAGIETLKEMKRQTDINIFSSELDVILENCEDAATQSSRELMRVGEAIQNTGMLEKAAMRSGVMFSAMMKPSVSAMAQTAIEGCTMGITEIQRALNENHSAGFRARSMAQEYLSSMEDGQRRLKDYL